MIKHVLRACALLLLAHVPARAQGWPGHPIVFGDGQVTLGGEVSASIAPEDTGFFNYTDYEHSTLRTLRLALQATVRAGDHLQILSEIRSENGARPEPYGLYLRIQPWTEHNLTIQVGRVPPTFGAFSRRNYPADNPLISYPLAYQYLTSIHPDALPASVDELLRMRGRGWLSNFTVGNLSPGPGVPLVSAFRWDTGVQVHAGNDVIDATSAVTGGTLSVPQVPGDSAGHQLAGRVVLHPIAGLVVGGSAARGTFVTQSAVHAALADAPNDDFTQTAWGADVEYSRDYYLLRAETVVSRWILPVAQTAGGELPLSSTTAWVEGRYKIRPGLYAAGRVDHLEFSTVQGSATSEPWDAPVTRWEIGAGYSLQRNLLLKGSIQHNVRSGGRVTRLNLAAAQIVFWF